MKPKILRWICLVGVLALVAFTVMACGSEGPPPLPPLPARRPQPAARPPRREAARPPLREAARSCPSSSSLCQCDPVTSTMGSFTRLGRMRSLRPPTASEDHHYGSAQLAAAADVGEMVETGGVDIGWIFTSFCRPVPADRRHHDPTGRLRPRGKHHQGSV